MGAGADKSQTPGDFIDIFIEYLACKSIEYMYLILKYYYMVIYNDVVFKINLARGHVRVCVCVSRVFTE